MTTERPDDAYKRSKEPSMDGSADLYLWRGDQIGMPEKTDEGREKGKRNE